MLTDAQRIARLKGAEANRRKKQERIMRADQEGRRKFERLTKRELLIAGLCLYWGEGAKTEKFSFINSDPAMLLFMKQWLETCFDVEPDQFIARVCINEMHEPRIAAVTEYWSRTLRLPLEQFRTPSLVRTSLKRPYENHDRYFGQLCLRVRKSADLRYRILGLISGLKDSKLAPLPA